RLQECGAARGDVRRPAVRGAAQRLDHRRDGLQLAGAGPAGHRGGRLARLPDRAGGRDVPERHVHPRQPGGGRALPLPQAAHPVLVVVSTIPATDAVVPRRRDRRWPPLLPLVIVTVLVACGLFAPWLAPRSPVEGSLGERLAAPMWMENA